MAFLIPKFLKRAFSTIVLSKQCTKYDTDYAIYVTAFKTHTIPVQIVASIIDERLFSFFIKIHDITDTLILCVFYESNT